MAFHDVRFPDDLALGARGGPRFRTEVTPLESGHEQRNIVWERQRCAFDVSYGVKTKAQAQAVVAFFYARYGRAHTFRFKDWSDYECDVSAGRVTLISGSTYQLYKRYTSGVNTYDRKITKPVSGSVTIAGGGSYSLNYATGIVTHSGGAAPTGWSGQFDVPCRFDSDELDSVALEANLFEVPQLMIVEVKD